MTIQTRAIVLHALRYGEADLIVKLFTQAEGLRSYHIRGVLKSKRGKLKASFFQPLTILEIEAVHKNKGNLERIKEARIAIPYKTLHIQMIKSSLVLFLSEILKNSIQEEEENPALYQFLETTFLWLDTHEEIANFHIAFMLKLTQYLGFYPDTSTVALPSFNLQEGCFDLIGANNVEGIQVEFLKKFLGTNFDESMKLKLNKEIRSSLINTLLTYFELHLHGFKKPKSLSILNEIYN